MAELGYWRNSNWKEDNDLAESIRSFVLKHFKRLEILDFLKRDFPQYAWRLGTLSRGMKHFGINYLGYNTTVEEVRTAF